VEPDDNYLKREGTALHFALSCYQAVNRASGGGEGIEVQTGHIPDRVRLGASLTLLADGQRYEIPREPTKRYFTGVVLVWSSVTEFAPGLSSTFRSQ
jgi:hypothetical protein